mmetsp:Transcript_44489/g.139441  ORF Transcript_44489/g.139441 Transcript_44489/m.139441 type:complete len:208 (-) Transcript_44489:314-937(-)
MCLSIISGPQIQSSSTSHPPKFTPTKGLLPPLAPASSAGFAGFGAAAGRRARGTVGAVEGAAVVKEEPTAGAVLPGVRLPRATRPASVAAGATDGTGVALPSVRPPGAARPASAAAGATGGTASGATVTTLGRATTGAGGASGTTGAGVASRTCGASVVTSLRCDEQDVHLPSGWRARQKQAQGSVATQLSLGIQSQGQEGGRTDMS